VLYSRINYQKNDKTCKFLFISFVCEMDTDVMLMQSLIMMPNVKASIQIKLNLLFKTSLMDLHKI